MNFKNHGDDHFVPRLCRDIVMIDRESGRISLSCRWPSSSPHRSRPEIVPDCHHQRIPAFFRIIGTEQSILFIDKLFKRSPGDSLSSSFGEISPAEVLPGVETDLPSPFVSLKKITHSPITLSQNEFRIQSHCLHPCIVRPYTCFLPKQVSTSTEDEVCIVLEKVSLVNHHSWNISCSCDSASAIHSSRECESSQYSLE
jgi:hypothetical protein